MKITPIVKFFFILLISFSASADIQMLTGAGASFPYPIYSKWFAEYNKKNPNIEINYQMIGSGGGIRQLLAKTVDFGASDAPMKERELKKSQSPIIHIPTVLGSVVISYNLPGLKEPLNLDGAVLSKIFMGEIKNWNHADIQALNKKAKLPQKSIVVVRRSDSSGTTFVFTDYLAKVSPQWKKTVGTAKTVKWPTGLGGKGNPGVAGQIANTPGSIGYIEYNYAAQNKLAVASIKNAAGEFIAPSTSAVSMAAESFVKTIPDDFRISITEPQGKGAYPISAFTYILIYRDMPKDKAVILKDFLVWAMDEGQKMASQLSYAPLPKALVKKVKAKINGVNEKPIKTASLQ